MSKEPVERFRPTSGRIAGFAALALSVGAVVIGVVDHAYAFAWPLVAAAVAAGVLVWASMLRPGLWVTQDDLVMRNMLHDVRIPLATIEQVVVRQVLAVSAGGRRFVSPAIGTSLRQTVKNDRGAVRPSPVDSYPVFVEERIRRYAEDAREGSGIRLFSAEQQALASGVRRSWAWPEIVALVAASVAFAVALVL